MFRTIYLYIKLRRNHIEITNLNTGETAARAATTNFSSIRNVVGSFRYADETTQATLKDLGIRLTFGSPGLKALIQQLEGNEGGLSDLEKRALRDLAENAGVRVSYQTDLTHELSAGEALAILKEGKTVF